MKSLNTLFAALLITSAGSAVAKSNVDLAVRGKITPSACEPSLPNGGNLDIGKISAKDLNVDTKTLLPTHVMQLTVTCDGSTLMALEAKDNREGSAFEDDAMLFGLGLINSSEKLGGMELRLVGPLLADGVDGRAIASRDGGLTWAAQHYFEVGNFVSVATTAADTPTPVQLLTADMNIQPIIAPTNGLTLTNEVEIDGSVTLTVKYL